MIPINYHKIKRNELLMPVNEWVLNATVNEINLYKLYI